MGLAPADVDACSLWQFTALVDGWRRAQGGDDLTAAEVAEISAALDRPPIWMQ